MELLLDKATPGVDLARAVVTINTALLLENYYTKDTAQLFEWRFLLFKFIYTD